MRHLQRFVRMLFASGLLLLASPVEAQVTTATLVGELRDSSGVRGVRPPTSHAVGETGRASLRLSAAEDRLR